MVETVHGPYKNRQMDIIFENWNTNSRQEYGDSFNKTSVDRMCGFMSVHGMWEVDACTGSQRHKEWFLNYQGQTKTLIFLSFNSNKNSYLKLHKGDL